MKFPYELSEQRLSLLSYEDRMQYELEHSIYYSKLLREEGLKAYQHSLLEGRNYYYQQINEDAEFNDLNDSEKIEMADNIAKAENLAIIDEFSSAIFGDMVGEGLLSESDCEYAKKQMMDSLSEVNISESDLNEDAIASGHDMTYWMGGFGGLVGGLLGGLCTILGGLLIAGKDKLAQKALERYMNKLVEMIDNGLNKRKSIFSFFCSKNSGNESQGCFRSVIENIERNRYTQGLVFAKAAGLVGEDAIDDAVQNDTTNGSFYQYFQDKVGNKINKLGK